MIRPPSSALLDQGVESAQPCASHFPRSPSGPEFRSWSHEESWSPAFNARSPAARIMGEKFRAQIPRPEEVDRPKHPRLCLRQAISISTSIPARSRSPAPNMPTLHEDVSPLRLRPSPTCSDTRPCISPDRDLGVDGPAGARRMPQGHSSMTRSRAAFYAHNPPDG